MQTVGKIESAALRLRTAYETRTTCEPVRDLVEPASLETGYAIQRANVRHWEDAGRRVVGRKVALSAKAVQQQMGVSSPTAGVLFDDMCAVDGAELSIADLVQPKLETEVAVVLERDLPHERHTVADVLSAIAYAVPAFEIVGSRVRNWDVSALDFIADNSAASMIVLGTRPKRLSDFDILRCAMETRRNGEVATTGTGAAVAGNPVNALIWLADALVRAGRPLEIGEIVMTGSLGPMALVGEGEHYCGAISGLGSVDLHFVP
ncbi:2-keto-4-pentenoate hydratase [Consotaella salsifontis]|uniref:2-keto-4-pentenoate hydratase n=1 Tax=Consotaella salsifontis TaxID=1365950 RepID=A0A1T4LI27_9HYPH|nr:fumarylacetoacetate hydrolase family protein [Consotaella salsifontis]SJZ54373.1 2-keto-4-pentenoate hydratase [Consotaella salsifontis]